MEFGFTDEQEKLRKEVRNFYINELPSDFELGVLAVSEELQSFFKALRQKVGARNWIAASWPQKYGGLGLTAIEEGICAEEQYHQGVSLPNFHAVGLLGPSMLLLGTEEQRERLIPPILRGEGYECFELLTEPDAGTDQANIQLRAVEDGDNFILNGQKMFVGDAYKPEVLFTLARTADTIPKHRGLTLFIIPADTPGISYRPLKAMGGQCKNKVFFDDVRVPRENMLGEVGRGFYTNLMVRAERASMLTGNAARDRRSIEDFIQLCREVRRNGKPLIEDPEVRTSLAQMVVENEVWRLTGWYATWHFTQRERLGPYRQELSGFRWKIWATKHADTMMGILGNYGQLKKNSKWARLAGQVERLWESARSMHGGGTPERVKVTVAERGLGLPSSRIRPPAAKIEEKR
ncbi:acyl-CoA dehydrogenase family protein [Chloroflexota bacterium]